MNPERPLVFALVVAAAVGTTLLADRYGNLTRLDDLEWKTLEWRQIAASRQESAESRRASPIVLVFFDEEATEAWPYLSPYPRGVLAELVEAVAAAGARTVGLDVFLERRFPELNAMDGGDDRLRRALEEAGNVVLVAPTEATDSGRVLRPPDPYFAGVAAGVGAGDFPTAFESIHEVPLAVRSGPELWPGFALAVYARSRGLDPDSLLRADRRTGTLELPGLPDALAKLPPGWDGTGPARGAVRHAVPIHYAGPPSHGERPGAFPAYRASEAVELARAAPEFFRDRIVLLGTGWHDQDRFRTPYYGYSPAGADAGEHYGYTFGVEVHATALRNLLDGTFVRPPDRAAKVILLAAVSAAAAGAVFLKGAVWGAAASALTVLATWVAGYGAYGGALLLPGAGTATAAGAGRLWVPLVAPSLAVLLSYLGSTAYVSVVEGREKRFIRDAFGKYLSPEVVEEIAADPGALRLGGEARTLTILFSDLSNFTRLSESMEPERVLSLLNRHLTAMTERVLAEEGTLDKYVGDAVMAFWNAPRRQEDHAARALRTAVRMQREMIRLNRWWRRRGPEGEPPGIRVGVNTGEVVVGNMGGEDRFDYSAVGDAVNLAARLEPANKRYRTRIIASQSTVDEVDPSAFRLRELDLMAVRGRSEPVRVHEVLELADAPLPPDLERALVQYERGLEAYRGRDWTLAAEYFEAALEDRPDDGPSRVYRDRCRTYVSDPPPADWDFVIRRS